MHRPNMFPLLIGAILALFFFFPELLEEPDYAKPVTPTVQVLATSTAISTPTAINTSTPYVMTLLPSTNFLHICKGDNEHVCESVTILFKNGKSDALWTSEVNPTEGAFLLGIGTTSEDGNYVTVVSQEPSGMQKIHTLNSNFKVIDTFEVDPAVYGTIQSIAGLTVSNNEDEVKMIIVTNKGHFQRHYPSDGSPSPAIDQTN